MKLHNLLFIPAIFFFLAASAHEMNCIRLNHTQEGLCEEAQNAPVLPLLATAQHQQELTALVTINLAEPGGSSFRPWSYSSPVWTTEEQEHAISLPPAHYNDTHEAGLSHDHIHEVIILGTANGAFASLINPSISRSYFTAIRTKSLLAENPENSGPFHGQGNEQEAHIIKKLIILRNKDSEVSSDKDPYPRLGDQAL